MYAYRSRASACIFEENRRTDEATSSLYTYVSRVASLIGVVSLSAHSQTPTYYPDATGVQYSPSLPLSQAQREPRKTIVRQTESEQQSYNQ